MTFKWPCDWNRPLSKEELAIARRLDRVPQEVREQDHSPMPQRGEFDSE